MNKTTHTSCRGCGRVCTTTAPAPSPPGATLPSFIPRRQSGLTWWRWRVLTTAAPLFPSRGRTESKSHETAETAEKTVEAEKTGGFPPRGSRVSCPERDLAASIDGGVQQQPGQRARGWRKRWNTKPHRTRPAEPNRHTNRNGTRTEPAQRGRATVVAYSAYANTGRVRFYCTDVSGT